MQPRARRFDITNSFGELMKPTILSIALDICGASAAAFEWDPNSRKLTKLDKRIPPRDVKSAITTSPAAVANLIGDYAREVQTSLQKQHIDAIAVSAPGTIDVATGVVVKSTRLGIRDQFDCRAYLTDRYKISATLVNDADAAARGEVRYGVGKTVGFRPSDDLKEFGDFAYVLISEGVGCALFINGEKYLGAGAAGHIGRMTIDPSGPFLERFDARGLLESYASREAISHHIALEFRREKDNSAPGASDTPQSFDRILSAITEASHIPACEIATAVEQGHPLAVAAINEAARYIGIAVGSLITIMNPPTVILGGDMVQGIPSYYTKTLEAAKRFTWSIAWNKTRVLKGELAEPQLWGAAHLAGECQF